MIKRYCINKINIATCALILICILSLGGKDKIIPYVNEEVIKESNSVIYLLDKDDYVSKVSIFIDKDNIEDIIKEKLIILRDGSEEAIDFKTVIPKETKINDIKVKEDNVYIDFSKDIIKSNDFENVIEAIVYSLTEINGINNIYITIDKEDINKYSLYNNPLNRHIGINKRYDVNDLKDINMCTMYFVKDNGNMEYYVPISKVYNSNDEKISIILDELKSSVYSVDNLESYISNDLDAYNISKSENTINIIFNDYIFESIGTDKILEEVKYTIGSSVIDSYGVKEVVFSTKDVNNIDSFKME